MKKVLLISILISISYTGFSQLNPIKNLSWHQWYSMPYNFYTLRWSAPEISLTDTLVGYNVYRDNSFYRFCTDTIINHSIPQDTSFGGENFIDNLPLGFYIHVTAVYNKTHLQSTYNDSIRCFGQMVGIDNMITEKSLSISPNPFSTTTQITLPQTYHNIILTMYDIQGKLVSQNQYNDKDKIILHQNQLNNGMYFLKLVMDEKEVVTSKIMVND